MKSRILIALLSITLCTSFALAQTAAAPKEREALIAFYKATDGDRWTNREGWLGKPGTECTWYGVSCAVSPADSKSPAVTSLALGENNLTGAVPKELELLTRLEWLDLFGNHLSGKVPESVTQRWFAGRLFIAAEPSLLSSVTEIDFELSASSLLCSKHRVVIRSDGSIALATTRCRNATANDGNTFCEVKTGKIWVGDFARLGALVEKSDFFALRSEYYRGMTEGTLASTRVTLDGQHHEVVNYANAGPFALWVLQQTIDGVASSAEWDNTETRPKCPSHGAVMDVIVH